MTRFFPRRVLAGLGALLLLCPTSLAGCPDSASAAKGFEVTYDDQARTRTVSIAGADVTYEILNGGVIVETIIARHGLVPVRRTSAHRTVQYAYNLGLDSMLPFKEGKEFTLSTLMIAGQAQQKIDFKYKVERAEKVVIGACSYDGLWIKAVSDAYTTTWFWIPELLVSTTIRIEKPGPDGQMVPVSSRSAIDIRQ